MSMNPYDWRDTESFGGSMWDEDARKKKAESPDGEYSMSLYHFLGLMNDYRQASRSNQRRRVAIAMFLERFSAYVPGDEMERIVRDVGREVGMNFLLPGGFAVTRRRAWCRVTGILGFIGRVFGCGR